jgi:uncharacterized protein (DUF111 family)
MRRLAAFLMTQFALAGAAIAQPATAPGSLPPPAVTPGLEDIAASLQRIEVLLRAQVEIQRVELLLKRADLATQEVLPIQTDLRMAKASRDAAEEQQLSQERRLVEVSEFLDNPPRTATDVSVRANEQMKHNLEVELRMTKVRVQKLRARVEEVEGELAKRTAERDDIKALVDRALARQPAR